MINPAKRMELNKIYQGDCIDVLKTMPSESVNCCITSPPYYGLRDYGQDGQIGLEETPEAFVQKLVEVFREVKRVLKDDGTLWLNLGDSYWGGGWRGSDLNDNSGDIQKGHKGTHCGATMPQMKGKNNTYKPKDLVGIPWMVAFALRADGWYLRQDIIWHKPNPMPESVTDRCTKSHEYIFLLSKSQKYFYDADAIKEKSKDVSLARAKSGWNPTKLNVSVNGANNESFETMGTRWVDEYANKRSVWTITTKSFYEAHFATFPEDLIVPCIKAGCPEGGVVLDPFGGAGTTALVAHKLRRDWVLIELSPDYIKIAEKRLRPHLKQMFLF